MRSSGLSVAWFSLVMSTHSFWQRCSPAPITRPEVPVCSVGLLGTPGCISWSDISTLDRKHMRQFDAVKGQGSVKSFFVVVVVVPNWNFSSDLFCHSYWTICKVADSNFSSGWALLGLGNWCKMALTWGLWEGYTGDSLGKKFCLEHLQSGLFLVS